MPWAKVVQNTGLYFSRFLIASKLCQGKLRVPTPRNITPGPGFYFKVHWLREDSANTRRQDLCSLDQLLSWLSLLWEMPCECWIGRVLDLCSDEIESTVDCIQKAKDGGSNCYSLYSFDQVQRHSIPRPPYWTGQSCDDPSVRTQRQDSDCGLSIFSDYMRPQGHQAVWDSTDLVCSV